VLAIDEIGYLSYEPDAANVLFHVANDRHLKKRPMIFTTNGNSEFLVGRPAESLGDAKAQKRR
jgi:DNA replication protein DnaC